MMTVSADQAKEARERLLADCDRMAEMLTALPDSHGRVADEVHAIRKLGKALRGGCRLFGLKRRGADEIKAIGRLLAAPRDAVSRQATWVKMEWTEEGMAAAAVSSLLEMQVHAAARRPSREVMEWCMERLSAARAAILSVPDDEAPTRMEKGVRKLSKRAMKQAADLQRRKSSDFHGARKAAKAWLGAIALLPQHHSHLAAGWTDLAEVLGDENDLATLEHWLLSHGFFSSFAPGLWKAVEEKRTKCRAKALDIVRGMD